MDSLLDILRSKDFDVPPEVTAIKAYVRQEFEAEVEVRLRGDKEIMIAAPSASLVNMLRLRGPQIKLAANTDRRLVFRVG